jgi:hypothetical protein
MIGQLELGPDGKIEDLTNPHYEHSGERIREESLRETEPRVPQLSESPDGKEVARFLRGMQLEG